MLREQNKSQVWSSGEGGAQNQSWKNYDIRCRHKQTCSSRTPLNKFVFTEQFVLWIIIYVEGTEQEPGVTLRRRWSPKSEFKETSDVDTNKCVPRTPLNKFVFNSTEQFVLWIIIYVEGTEHEPGVTLRRRWSPKSEFKETSDVDTNKCVPLELL